MLAIRPNDCGSRTRRLSFRGSVVALIAFSSLGFAALTSSLSPSNATVGVTNAYLVGTASPGATVSESETWPDGTTHGPYTTTANGSGSYSMGPFIIQQLGLYSGTVHDSISGSSIPITYSGTGNFNVAVNTTSQTVTKGSAASYIVTVRQRIGFRRDGEFSGLELGAGAWRDGLMVVVIRDGAVGWASAGDVHDSDLFEYDGRDV